MRINSAKQTLKDGGVCVGHIVMEFASPGLVTVLANIPLDFVLFDTEHTRFSLETVCGLIRHARSVGLPACVRVPRGQTDQMSRFMDAGADGIMVPNVQNREEAEQLVQATKYAPLGNRGAAFGIAHDDYEIGDITATMRDENAQTLLITQIESEQGVANVEEIMAVEGVDVGWIGHFDLTQSMGIPGQFDHPDFLAAEKRVVAACEAHGKVAGYAGATPEVVTELVRKGFRCLAYSNDVRIYRNALKAGVQAIRRQLV